MKTGLFYAFGAFLLVSCSGSQGKGSADSDSIEETASLVDSIPAEPRPVLTKDSIGGIFIGESVNDVPDAIEGLYTAKENGASPDAVTIVFKGAEGERFIAYDFGEGKIDVINLIDTVAQVKAPRGMFGIGDKFSNVLQLPGVETEWSGYDNPGTWYWKWEGLWFAPSQETISENLSRRLYQPIQAPTPADFDDSVTVGFIGTGLPF